MKFVLPILGLVLVLGSTAGTLYVLQVPPFAPKAAKKQAAAKAAAAAPGAATAPDVELTQPAAAGSHEPAPAVKPTPTQKPAQTPAAKPAQKPVSPADDAVEKSVTRMATVYEQMPADESAKIMEKLPDPLVEKMLRRMDDRQVGKILLAFKPDRAARLTETLSR